MKGFANFLLLLSAVISLCVSFDGSGFADSDKNIKREVVETEPEDNEKEDEDLSEPHDETQYVKHTNKRSDANSFMIKSCSHPETSKSIKPGHFSYNKDTG